jgi:hypothetical protein
MKIEIKVTPIVAMLILTIAPLLFTNKLGAFPAFCFCLASAFLVIRFLFIPLYANDKYAKLGTHYYQIEKPKVDKEISGYIQTCYGFAGMFYIVALVAFLISHSQILSF